MNIVRENIDDLSALLKVTVTPEDYGKAVESTLKNYKRKANVPGFRPGMVPMGMIQKMYKKGVTAEESYRAANQAAFKYIQDNKINAIGDLMPSEKQGELDFENNTDFEFIFQIGMTSEINVELTNKDKVTRYEITPTDEMREGYRSNFTRRYGKLVDVDTTENDDALNVTLEQGESKIEDAYVGLISLSEDKKAPFLGKKVGDQLAVNVNELYPTESQRASILGMKAEELADIDPNYTLTITKIRRFQAPELNEEFFKLAFPGGEVKSEAEFALWIEKVIENDLQKETHMKFEIDFRNFLLHKADVQLPREFLKKWLFEINEGKFTMEQIEKDLDAFMEMMRWDLMRKHYVAELSLQIENAEQMEEAKERIKMQLAQYGMPALDNAMVENYAQSLLANKEELPKINDKIYDAKIVAALAERVTVETKNISVDEFNKLFEK